MKKDTELYAEAIRRWGIEFQETMAIEEMAELTKVICKLHRQVNGSGLHELAEEIADVRLMLDQLEWAYCQQSHVETWRQRKLERLETLLWPEESSTDTITDGYAVWSAYCPDCGKRSMSVVRPGKVQCDNCGGRE